MGKTKKIKPSQAGHKASLGEEIESSKVAKPTNRIKIRRQRDDEEQFVVPDLSRKILSTARDQQRELESNSGTTLIKKPTKLDTRDADSDSEQELQDNLEPDMFYENIEVNKEDETAMEQFMKRNSKPLRTLADVIMEKFTEHHTEVDTAYSDIGAFQIEELDPKVREMFEGVREVLKKYRSGKLPKAFKMIPSLVNWEQILFVTDPPSWSAAAMYQATRIFASNLKEPMAQRFYNLVLLPRVRDDLAEYKRLNFHLYQALRMALYKPGGFMKGFLLPLLESGNCTLREAIIVGSVIARNSIPLFHSAAAILKIAEMDYTGANSIFLRILFDKKYALPYRVVDSVVFHFIRFEHDSRELPVLWHQALLAFIQRYKGYISSEQKDSLLSLLKKQSHYTLTPEIRRELQHASCKDEIVEESKPMDIQN